MKKLLTLTLTLLTFTVIGQTFEGEVIYKNEYESKIPNVTNEQLTSMMGATQIYIIKDGNYKSSANGLMFEWQLYVNEDNKLYTKMSNSDAALWNDGSSNPDEVLDVEINKGVIEILGYNCDEVILKCKSGIQKYYFNSILSVDVSLFEEHQYGNWYSYLQVAKALPLKSVIANSQFTLTTTATQVNSKSIDVKDLQLPEGMKTIKNAY